MVLNMDYSPSSNANRMYRDRIAYLESKIAYLKKTLETLASPLFDPLITLGERGRFTPSERKVLCVLHTYKGKCVSHEPFITALYGCDSNPPQDDILKVFICKIRKKLVNHDILCDWGVGYVLVEKRQ